MNKIIFIIFINVTIIGNSYTQDLIGKDRRTINANMESTGGLKIDTEFTKKDTADAYYFKESNILKVYLYNINDIAYSVMYQIYDSSIMMQMIKKFNKEYIENGDLTWIYYLRNMKLTVNLVPDPDGDYFSIIYENPMLFDTYIAMEEDINDFMGSMTDEKDQAVDDSIANAAINDVNQVVEEADKIDILNEFSCTNLEWNSLKRGNTLNGIKFTVNNQLLFKNKIIKGINIENNTEEIKVSPTSYNDKYIICFISNDDDSYEVFDRLFICDLEELSSKVISLDAPPLLWLCWSPDLTHVFVGSYYELGDYTVYNVNLKTNKIYKLDFSFGIKKDQEMNNIEFNNFYWISKNEIHIKSNISCNPYVNEDCDDKIILRTNTYYYNVNTNKCFLVE